MPTFKIIAAMSLNHVIGNKQGLPWHIPEELKWFRQVTLKQTLLMGRKTFESMGSQLLPHRTTYILTHQTALLSGANYFISSVDEDLPQNLDTIWVAGGATLYAQFLPLCSELILSVIQQEIIGDTFFPEFKHLFRQAEILKHAEKFEVQRWVKIANSH